MKSINKSTKPAVHILQKELLNPTNPIMVNLIGAGGTGSQVLTALARMNCALNALGHAGLSVRLFDDDTVSNANMGRQLFATSDIGQSKATCLINRINLFFGTNWKAITEQYNKGLMEKHTEYRMAAITISCVDTVSARFDIEKILATTAKHAGYYLNTPCYWMDFGNNKDCGQVILSTVKSIGQPASKKYKTIATLPAVTKEFKEQMMQAEAKDNTPSCSLAEALHKQDLFINSSLANLGCSLMWQMLREGMIFNRGFFLNLKDFRVQPLKVA